MSYWRGILNTFKRWMTTEAPKRDPKKTMVKMLGQAIKNRGGGGDFEQPEVDLEEISRAYWTDSYIRRAVDKHYMLMFKSGWEISSNNQKASDYVWTRLKLMSEATGMTFEQLMSRAALDFVLFANAFIVKARMKGSIPGVKAQGYTGKQPVAGYFILPPTTVQVSRDDNGKILMYQQVVNGGTPIEFKPEDIIHIYYNKPSGRAYGIPFVYNALDDIRLLRQIEENVARMIHRNIFPLYVYQVGLDKPGFEATDEEIEDVKAMIQNMPLDGGLVVPERHNIKVIGANGNAIDASDYLKYFRQRVFTGLGVSDSVMGIGDSANKSTSDNQSADLIDTVKEFQRIFAETIQKEIINELLFEGGFDPILNPDDEVRFEFYEIELDAKIKKENHDVQLFMQNAITHDELRARMGLDPVKDESRLYFRMIGNAQAQQGANQAGLAKDQPQNQYGKKLSPGKPTKASFEPENDAENGSTVLTISEKMVNFTAELQIDEFERVMKGLWNGLQEDVMRMLKNRRPFQEVKGLAVELTRQTMKNQVRKYLTNALLKGLYAGNAELRQANVTVNVGMNIERVVRLGQQTIDRLFNDVTSQLSDVYKPENENEITSKIMGIFNSNAYRIGFFANREIMRAYNYGRVVSAKNAGMESVDVIYEGGNCDICKPKSGTIQLADHPEEALLDMIPPHHPHCDCFVQFSIPAKGV